MRYSLITAKSLLWLMTEKRFHDMQMYSDAMTFCFGDFGAGQWIGDVPSTYNNTAVESHHDNQHSAVTV